MGQDGRNYANYNSIWRPSPTLKYIRENKNIKFSPALCKYFTVAVFDISCGIYKQYFYTNIRRISPRLGGYRDGCMIFYVFVVFHSVIYSN